MNSENLSDKRKSITGTVYAVAAFVMWGLLPGYWKMLKAVPSDEIVFHRIIWTFVISIVLVFLTGRREALMNIIKNRKLRIIVFFSSLTIVSNWLIYVYAVNTGRIVEASLGYFINPLVSILLGMIVLRERLTRIQVTALILAACAVIYMSAGLGSFPWIALTLAFSFGLYGLIKKMGDLDSIASLGVETLFLLPAAGYVILSKECSGTGAMGNASLSMVLILLGTGVVSAFPLFLFAQGARMIPLSRIGFIQYVSPSIMLLIGVAVYGENFSFTHAVSFSLIWCALILYTVSSVIKIRGMRYYSE
jgi:chloramphenicol-sensitive protein RarD